VNGILLIDKPKGWTSFDAVNKVRHTVQASGLNSTQKKRFPVGHTGTLDPLATGLLVLLLGSCTKEAPALTKLDKRYEVTMRLGQTSTTGDEEGEKTQISSDKPPEAEILQTIASFEGETSQIPPAFSAMKVNGQRAYKLARAGKPVEMKPRNVHIDSLKVTEYDYPFVRFTAVVSSGTYIRSLVEDIGTRIGTGAYMSDLRRTRIGEYDIANAITPEDITGEVIYKHCTELGEINRQ
jgi:tRNA pseudouridine55 synthase